MAIDTRDRRASCLGIDGAYRIVFPDPDGSLASQADRQQMAGTYPGILASTPSGTTVVAYASSLFRLMLPGTWRRMG